MRLSSNQAKGRLQRLSTIGFHLIRKLFSSKVSPNIGENNYKDIAAVVSYSTGAFKDHSKSFECDDGVIGIAKPKSKDECVKYVNEQPVESDDAGNLEVLNSDDNLLESIKDESTGNKLETNENVKEQSIDRLANIADKNSKTVVDQVVRRHDVIKDDVGKCGCNVPVQSDKDESSFSNSGLINFSGPIAFSGSFSLRSFAFPELESEWDISPVRRPKPYRRSWDGFAENVDESSGHKLETNENVNEQSVNQLADNEDKNSKNVDEKAVQTYDVIKDDVGKYDHSILGRSDEGELSFSSLITSSEPIAFSGSVSLQSDTSRASSLSFAYPVLQSEWNGSPVRMPEPDRLQSEWNSNPVRMAKPDKRHFNRRCSWRSGVLCCRF